MTAEANFALFASAEEAWLWYASCQLARLDGARFSAGAGQVARPCDPDDIFRAVDGLYRRRVIDGTHITVLGEFGRRQRPPDPWGGDPAGAAILWDEALDRLTTILKTKGIVE